MATPLDFTTTEVRDWVGATVYRQALELTPRIVEPVWGEAARAGDLVASAHTAGPRRYDVTLYRFRGVFSSSCSCADIRNCVHAAALALVLRQEGEEQPQVAGPAPLPVPAPEPAGWEARLERWARPPAGVPAPRPLRATFVYRLRWPVGPTGEAELQLQVRPANSATAPPLAWHLYRLEPDAAEVERLVEPAIRRLRARNPTYRDGESRTAVSWLVVPHEAYDELLLALAMHPRVEDQRRRPLELQPMAALRASLAYHEGALGPELRPVILGPRGAIERAAAVLLGPVGGRWAAVDGLVCRVAPAAEAAWADEAAIQVPASERQAFERRWLPELAAAGSLIDARQQALGAWPLGQPRPQLLLEEQGADLLARVGFVYGDERVEPLGGSERAGLVTGHGGELLKRDVAAEAAWVAALREVLPVSLLAGDAALDFLSTQAASLIAAGWEVVGRERLRYYRLSTAQPAGQLTITSGADWFDVHNEVILGSQKVAWESLQAALQQGARYVKLGNGEWGPLPAAWLATRQALRARFGTAEDAHGVVRLPCHQAPLIASLLDDTERVEADPAWHAFRARLECFGSGTATPLPPGFVGQLRPYQQHGLDYLVFLRDHGLHGILADDMGLGKTVQAAALLALNHPSEQGPSLIVAPTSVLANWEAELARFVPGLRVLRLHGQRRELAAIAHHDVVITSYATARLDLATHLRHTYHTVLLDEAQAIKNARSRTALAMRQLRARHRLCLTGTPIENDTRDLWSLFAFLLPGMLGSADAFRIHFANPIALGERGAREALRVKVAPFILRRLKGQVAKDLPPRTDITLHCELLPAQRRAYDALLTSTRDRIQAKLKQDGLEHSRLTILDALLKLRQLCCHPALVGTPETLHLESGKLEACLELVQELSAGGHRALVFSQFTQMLALLRQRLDQQGIPYEYLDGSTRDRQRRVDRFNASDTPLFLISLKAGGSGLNLTGADYVIHYDPWWNPASEDQATDRAHRIGQLRPVFSYKLVARDTVEEKLVALQAEKRGLVRDLLASDAAGKLLTAADVEALFT